MPNPGKKLLTINFTPEQLARLKSRAYAMEMTMSRYVRYCVEREMDGPTIIRQTLTNSPWSKFEEET